MPTLSYGEDGLTYWALSGHLAQFLRAIGDKSNAEQSLFIFRPSFGRAGSAAFGEFDAIVATASCVYLIETKWDGSSKTGKTPLIAPRQLLRHWILRWLREKWIEQSPPDWTTFTRVNTHAFEREFPGKTMAPTGSKLADNIVFYLSRLTLFPQQTEDVLLYFHREGQRVDDRAAIRVGFRVLPFVYKPLNDGGVFDVQDAVRS